MAFALTKFSLQTINNSGTSKYRGIQRAVLNITQANTDTDLDIGDDSGTFWTAALANSTWGALAAKAQAKLQEIDDVVDGIIAVGGSVVAKNRVTSSPSAGELALAVQNQRPNITYNSGDAPTEHKVIIDWLLSPEKQGISGDWNI